MLAMETRNWRLVICRIGKIGHGEFKGLPFPNNIFYYIHF